MTSGCPFSTACMIETTLLKPSCHWPLTTGGTIAAPPAAALNCSVMPYLLKKPLSWPR